MPAGSTVVTLTEQSGGGTKSNNSFAVTLTGPSETNLQYDDNGNLINDGTNHYGWDAENRLILVTFQGTGNNSHLQYDSFGRCIKIIETTNGSITSTKQFIWCGTERCEVRDGSGGLLNQFFALGQVNVSGGTPGSHFYNLSHRDDVVEQTDSTGAIESQFTYSPYGEPTRIAGSGASPSFGFAGMYQHQRSGLSFTLFRPYSPSLGRWLSRDPLGEIVGNNLYGYVENNPIDLLDPLGLVISFAGDSASVSAAKSLLSRLRKVVKDTKNRNLTELLTRLDKRDVDVVVNATCKKVDPRTKGFPDVFKGPNSSITINPNLQAAFTAGLDVRRGNATPLELFVHELGHAYDFAGGNKIPGWSEGDIPVDEQVPYTVGNEIRAIQQQQQPRIDYYGERMKFIPFPLNKHCVAGARCMSNFPKHAQITWSIATKIFCFALGCSFLSFFMQPADADYCLRRNWPGDSFFSADHNTKSTFDMNGDIIVSKKGFTLYTIHTEFPFLKPPNQNLTQKVRSGRDLGFLTGDIYLSKDGHSLIWLLLPRLYGHVIVKLSPENGTRSYTFDQSLMSMPALALFKDGKLLKLYRLSDLLRRPEKVQQTASHTGWLEVEGNGSQPRFTTDEKFFLFETVGSFKYKVSTQTGALQ